MYANSLQHFIYPESIRQQEPVLMKSMSQTVNMCEPLQFVILVLLINISACYSGTYNAHHYKMTHNNIRFNLIKRLAMLHSLPISMMCIVACMVHMMNHKDVLDC